MWKVYWKGARPRTLTAALVPILAATALAIFETGRYSPVAAIVALVASLFIQIGTNLFNDVLDHRKGTDRADRVGPTRITAAGLASPETVFRWAVLSFGIAACLGLWLVYRGGWPILLIGASGLASGYLYTGGPYPLAYKGLGDLFVVLYFGLAAVCGMYGLHTGGVSGSAWWVGLEIGFLATVLIAINNLRDAKQDLVTGKLTLPARFGDTFGKLEITFLALAPILMHFAWSIWLAGRGLGRTPAMVVGLVPGCVGAALAVRLVAGVWRTPPGPSYNRFLAQAAGLHLVFGVLFAIALVWARRA